MKKKFRTPGTNLIKDRREGIKETGTSEALLIGAVRSAQKTRGIFAPKWERSDQGGAELHKFITIDGHIVGVSRLRTRDGTGVPRKSDVREIMVACPRFGLFRFQTECGTREAKKLAKLLLEAVYTLGDLEFLGMPKEAKDLMAALIVLCAAQQPGGLEAILNTFRP